MDAIKDEIIKNFGNKIRVRVCGVCIQNDKILLIKHHSLGTQGFLWSPPGGGVNFGETVEEALKREFEEETGLTIEVGEFLFVHEFLEVPLHAVELFFNVRVIQGTLSKGTDPEMDEKSQIINEVRFLSEAELNAEPLEALHNMLQHHPKPAELVKMRGHFKYIPNSF